MTPELSTNHADRGTAKLLQQFKNSPLFVALLRAFLNQIQDLENATNEVILIRGIAASEGVGLDAIGRIVGRMRLGLLDPDYRIALRAQIRINRSSGRIPDLIAVGKLSLPDSVVFTLKEYFPATVVITVADGSVAFNITILYGNLIRAKSSGVQLLLVYADEPEENTFAFSSIPDTVESNPDRGFDGGHFVNVI